MKRGRWGGGAGEDEGADGEGELESLGQMERMKRGR